MSCGHFYVFTQDGEEPPSPAAKKIIEGEHYAMPSEVESCWYLRFDEDEFAAALAAYMNAVMRDEWASIYWSS